MFKKRQKNKAAIKQLIGAKVPNSYNGTAENQFSNILFCPLNGTVMNLVREGIMGISCQLRGAHVQALYLNSSLPNSEFYKTNAEKFIYLKKVKNNIKYCKQLGIEPVRTSDFEKRISRTKESLDEKTISKFEYKGVLIGDLVVASTVRAFLCNGPEWDNPDFKATAERVLNSAIYLIDLYDQILEDIKPDKLVMSHGIYITWGTLFRLARKKGIAVDVYGSSYRKNSLRFYHNAPNAPFPPGYWSEFENITLNEKENKILDDYIEGRETQKDDNISLFDEKTEIPEQVRTFVESNKDKKLFCLFTNISWDAFAFATGDTFASMLEWVEETINYFNDRSDAALIIKAHPAEIYHKTPEKYRVRTFMADKKLNNNILFIREDEQVKPFWLYDKIDVGLIHISTVAIEMALKQIPVLTSGAKGHYSDKGFTIDPNNKKEYFNNLTELCEGSLKFSPDIEAARKYMFFRFFREALAFDLIELENLSTIKSLKIQDYKDLEPGKNQTLDIICEGILNNGKFVANYG